MGKRIFITGGTGFVGSALARALVARGDKPVVLTRDAAHAAKLPASTEIVEGDPAYAGPWQQHVAGCDAIVNLVGASAAGRRWDARYRQILCDSRIETTHVLVSGLAELTPEQRPRVLVSASGVDYYPQDVDLGAFTTMDEDDFVDESVQAGDGFFQRLCRDWEAEARAAAGLGLRVVLARIGLVLGHNETLERMVRPYRWFVGGPLGTGRQWMSWIHIDDAVRALLFALDTDAVTGPINLVAPRSVRARQLGRAIGRALGRPSWLRVPPFVIKLVLGEFSEYVLAGRCVIPAALTAAGFEWNYGELDAALSNLLN